MRKWGQHFLASDAVQRKIADACGIGPGDEVLEIGPGRGELTQHYFKRAKRSVLVEIDPRLTLDIQGLWGHLPQFNIIHADFRKLDPGSLGFSTPPVVLSDLPYYASKPILRKILEWGGYSRAILTFQKEVALRVAARQGEPHYGALSLWTRLYAESEILFDLEPREFRPRPKVISTVLRLTPSPSGVSQEVLIRLERLIRVSFAQKRKTLVNNLRNGFPALSKTAIEAALQDCGVAVMARGHELPLEQFKRIAAHPIFNENA